MNYIPGFSNYLQKSVPRYALGGRVNQGEPLIDDMEFSDYGLGGPMMGEAVVGFDLANPMLGGPEQGGSYTGGMGGGDSRTAAERLQAILDVNPYVAPTEGMNLDPITSRGQTGYYFANELGLPARYGDVGSPKPADPATYDPNAKYIEPMPGFVPVDPNATYRLVNGGTDGSVVYSGAGEEGLRNVFQQANKLTLDNPKNAYWGVEVFNPATGNYDRVAENQGPNGLGIVGKIAGVALPIAAAIATGGASLGVQIAAGAAAGGLGGFLAGRDPLTSALIGGASAGIGNVSGLNKAIGGALGKAGGALGLGGVAADATVGGLSNAAGNLAGEQIVVTGLSKAAQAAINAAASAAGNTALSQGLKSGLSEVTGYKTPAEKFAQQPSPVAEPMAVAPEVPYDGIRVIGPKLASASGAPFAAGFPVPVDAMLSGVLAAAQPLPQQQPTAQEPTAEEPTAEDIEAAKNPMVVTGGGLESLTPDEILLALSGVGGLTAATAGGAGASSNVVNGADQANGDIVVSKARPYLSPEKLAEVMASGVPTSLLPDNFFEPPSTDVNKKLTAKDIADYLRLASLGVSTVGGLLGDKGGGSGGTIPAGMGGLSSVFGKQLPTSTLLGGAGGGALPASTLASQGFNSPQNYYRYGYGPEQSFFDYATQGAPNTSRAYTGYEGTTAEDAFAPQPMRVATPQITLPQPITTPIPNNPAGPSMYAPEVDSMRFARGGFAVEGAGDGRDDKIPALLSDGEYVFDAETVALLGNGSNKAGAKLLDSFRVKVRKQKGKKLARGKFSDNAKRPEHYLAGGKS